MRILIVGASGLVGSNCHRYFSQQGWEVTGTYFSYATEGLQYYNTLQPDDERNADIAALRPDVIMHCGALTHVDYCEQHPDESYAQTVVSTQNLIALAQQCSARFVYFSTDYVFDGNEGPYKEDDAVNPLSVYARHKLEAEQLVQQAFSDALILRITNVYGDEARGKNFVARIIQQCLDKQKLTLKLPLDQYATPVNAADLARAVFLLLRDGHSGIFHMAATDFVNRIELALKVLQYFPDAQYELLPVTTEELQQPAPRPLIGGLIAAKFKAIYPDFLFSSVDDYVRSKTELAVS